MISNLGNLSPKSNGCRSKLMSHTETDSFLAMDSHTTGYILWMWVIMGHFWMLVGLFVSKWVQPWVRFLVTSSHNQVTSHNSYELLFNVNGCSPLYTQRTISFLLELPQRVRLQSAGYDWSTLISSCSSCILTITGFSGCSDVCALHTTLASLATAVI